MKSPIETLRAAYRSLIAWLDDYRCDVDPQAFRLAAYDLGRVAASAAGLQRAPWGCRDGVPAVEFAALVLGETLPPLVLASDLPGAPTLRASLEREVMAA